MGSGTDVARESADIVLLGNDLMKLAETVYIARRARGIIRFNFAGTIAVDAVGVALAAFGMLNPLLAAFIHVSSELMFILNSARLLPVASRSAGLRERPVGAPAVQSAAYRRRYMRDGPHTHGRQGHLVFRGSRKRIARIK
jgi:hypothetical protein